MIRRSERQAAGRVACVAVSGLAAALLACSTSATSPNAGSLTVSVAGTTGGLESSVTISGPGISKVLSKTTTLSGLPAGSYVITPTPALDTSPVVSHLYAATVSLNPVEITDGSTTSTAVTYGLQGGSGGLWEVGGVDAGGDNLNRAVEYTAPQLTTTSSVTPAVTLGLTFTLGHNIDPSGAAFDAGGDLWIANQNSNDVVVYAPPQLNTTGNVEAALTLTGPEMAMPTGLALDARGNLWVTNIASGTIVEYAAAQLTSSGTLVPAVTLTPPGVHPSPTGLAFDNSENLWYIDIDNYSIRELAAAQLGTSGSPSTAVVITKTMGGVALAFNPHSHSLWLH